MIKLNTASKSIIQEILNSALENSHHNNNWYEKVESKSGARTCTRCNKSYIEEKTRIRTDDGSVIIRMIHSTNDDDLISFCEVEMVGGGGGLH